jgi:hypothetical protein
MTALSGSQYKPPALPEVIDIAKNYLSEEELRQLNETFEKPLRFPIL